METISRILLKPVHSIKPICYFPIKFIHYFVDACRDTQTQISTWPGCVTLCPQSKKIEKRLFNPDCIKTAAQQRVPRIN